MTDQERKFTWKPGDVEFDKPDPQAKPLVAPKDREALKRRVREAEKAGVKR